MNFHQPIPAIPVSDVEKAQEYYRDIFGFKVEWIMPEKHLGAVSHGETVLFFRRSEQPIQPDVLWVYCDDVDETYEYLKKAGANIIEEIENKPWKLRQFRADDFDGNRYFFHHGPIE